MSGGLGGEAHEQVAPLESCVKSEWSAERKEDFGKGVTSTFRHGLT